MENVDLLALLVLAGGRLARPDCKVHSAFYENWLKYRFSFQISSFVVRVCLSHEPLRSGPGAWTDLYMFLPFVKLLLCFFGCFPPRHSVEGDLGTCVHLITKLGIPFSSPLFLWAYPSLSDVQSPFFLIHLAETQSSFRDLAFTQLHISGQLVAERRDKRERKVPWIPCPTRSPAGTLVLAPHLKGGPFSWALPTCHTKRTQLGHWCWERKKKKKGFLHNQNVISKCP